LAVLGSSVEAHAKQFGVHSPTGRRIYGPGERFGKVVPQGERTLVSEVAIGSGPEGNVGVLLGWLNFPFRKLDIYGGVGIEANPAWSLTASLRYTFKFACDTIVVGDEVQQANCYRIYLSGGGIRKDTYEVGILSHSVFSEVGYTEVIRRTYRASVGVGLRWTLARHVVSDSPLRGPQIDPVELSGQLDEVSPIVLLLSLRFSRAF
jgi:hypothetical protein